MLKFFFIFISVLVSICEAKPPELTPHSTRSKIEEILKAHVKYKNLTPDLVHRTLQNFLEELDPTKTYFLEPEIQGWMSPGQDLLEAILRDYKMEKFTLFDEIHTRFVQTIERRRQIDNGIDPTTFSFASLEPINFKDLVWAKSETELSERLKLIKNLQLDAASKIDEETTEVVMQRIAKRRLKREEELNPTLPKEKLQLVLSLILKSVTAALDTHTAYFTPSEAKQFMIQVQQRLFGIGAQLKDNLNGFLITHLVEEGPADRSKKIKLGDLIIAVDGEPVVGMDIVEAVELIRGKEGTRVTLTILRKHPHEEEEKEAKLDVEISRGEVVLKESRFESSVELYGDGAIGYLHLHSFYQDPKSSSAQDLANTIDQMKRDHQLKGVILDLRSNAGGLLPQAVAVAGLFIHKGIVVSIKNGNGDIQHLRHIEDTVNWEGPLVILINRASASASEIVAQTLQDYGRAIIVGDPESYGKGSYQTFTLEHGDRAKVNPQGEYKVTQGMYYTVSGDSPQLKGVKPQIVVPGIFSEMELGERFAKYPLENDHIHPNFEDNLLDVPLIHREQVARLYKFNLQEKLSFYDPFLEPLKQNSTMRIQTNKNYQHFLTEIKLKEDGDYEAYDKFGKNDLQKEETINIMKDLIFLIDEMNTSYPQAA